MTNPLDLIGLNNPFKEFAHKKDFVYFSNVDDHDNPIKGMTFSLDRRDKHAVHGRDGGFDFTLLLREVTLEHPANNAKSDYVWTILAMPLSHEAPHLLLLTKKDDSLLHQSVFGKYHDLRAIPSSDSQFDVYSTLQGAQQVNDYLSPEVMQLLSTNQLPVDIELDSNALLLHTNSPATLETLNSLLNFGVELAKLMN